MNTDKHSYYICTSEDGSGSGNDHISVFEAGVREGLRRARGAENLDSKRLSRLELVLIDLRSLTEEVENLIDEAEDDIKQNARELSQKGQPLLITVDKTVTPKSRERGEVGA